MSEIYLYYNGKLLEAFSGENNDKVIDTFENAVKFEVILNNEINRYIFEVKLDEENWKLKG